MANFHTLHYRPIRVHERLVTQLRQRFGDFLKFKAIEFEEIPRLKGPGHILMWGDGFEHSLSYHFDLEPEFGRRRKVVLDAHTDTIRSMKVTFESHCGHSSEREGLDVVVFVPSDRGLALSFGNPETDFIDYDAEHLSVDFDISRGFPVPSYFQNGTIPLSNLLEFTREKITAGKVARVDFGGTLMEPDEGQFGVTLYHYESFLSIILNASSACFSQNSSGLL